MPFRSRRLAIVLLLASLGAVGLMIDKTADRSRETGVSTRRQRLLAAFGPARPFEGRLFGLQHADLDPRRVNLKSMDRKALRSASEALASNRCRSASCRADLALVAAFSGRLDEAVALLRSAAADNQTESWLASDLSAVLLARWRIKGEADDLLHALESADQAVHGPRVPLEARFNRALALQELSLRSPARLGWQDYLSREDPGSAWAEEARSRLAAVTAPPKSAGHPAPGEDRERAEERLGLWAEAALGGRETEAKSHLTEARATGRRLASQYGEHAIEDAVAAIDAADETERTDLASGHRFYRRGLASYQRSGFSEAGADFVRAFTALERAHSPFAAWARLRAAVCDLQRFRYREATATLDELVNSPAAARSPSLAGSTHRSLGLIRGIGADPAASVAEYQAALEAFAQAGELESVAAVESLVAESLGTVGDWRSASRHVMSALRTVADSNQGRARYLVALEASELSEELDLLRTALLFNDEALRSLPPSDTAGLVAGLRRKASLCAELGLRVEARAALAQATRILPQILDPMAQMALRGDLLAAEATILVAESPRRAIGTLSSALDIYRDTRYTDQLPSLLVKRARSYAAAGQPTSAENDLLQALGAVEDLRRRTREGDQESLLEQSGSIYDEMTRVQLSLGHAAAAFLWSDRSRAGRLAPAPQSLPRDDEAAASLIGRLEDSLTPGTAIVEYALTGETFQAWILQRGNLYPFTLSASVRNIRNLVERLVEAGEGGRTAAFEAESTALFNAIVAPLLDHLRTARRIVFVLDGPLHQVPFAALRDKTTGHYLVEDFEIVVSPSAAVYVTAAQRQAAFSGPPESVLAFADPAIDRRTWPSLSDLPATRAEAEEIGALYPRSALRLGEQATPQAFLREVPRSSVLHLAAHAIANPRHPELAALILAAPPSGPSTGTLYARDLEGLRLPSTRLVFLAACGSLGGPIGRGSAASSLARPFLTAGVPSVVGTLWPVDDEATRPLAVSFHRFLRRGLAPAAALRAAQLEQLAAGRENRTALAWAAFQLLGS